MTEKPCYDTNDLVTVGMMQGQWRKALRYAAAAEREGRSTDALLNRYRAAHWLRTLAARRAKEAT